MGAVTPSELWRLWHTEQITPEMAIGQLIQNQVNQEQTIQRVNQAHTTFRRELDGFAAQLKTQQKLLETLQRQVAGPAATPKPAARKEDANASAQK